MREFIKNNFLEKHGYPNNIDFLEQYLDFIDNYILEENNEYFEVHHILPRSEFPEFINEEWNKIKLKYQDHVRCHELLFMSFNIRSYQRPLNYMNSGFIKNKEALSNCAKKGWENFRKNEEKYNKFRESKREIMSSWSKEKQSELSKRGWTKEKYDERCRINKNIWTPELKIQKSIQSKKYFNENPDEASRRLKKRWDNITEEKMNEFTEKMILVNSDPMKRKISGDSIRNKWGEEGFREKMKSRKKRGSGVGGYLCISPENKIYEFTHQHVMLDSFNFNLTLIRKFLNTDNKVKFQRSKMSEKTKNTINWKFYTKNYIKENGKTF
jgi:hypothetical protein